MPLPHPPGYRPPGRQQQIDRRRIVFAGILYALLATVIVTLGHRAARANGRILHGLRVQPLLVVAAAAGACGAWSETMRQLALVARDRPRDSRLM